MLFDSLTIVGVGLIGGSIGLAAKARGLSRHVVGVGRSAEKLAEAKARGIVDDYTTDLATGVAKADVVVICSPVDHIAAQVLEAAKYAPGGALITDAGSTKANIVRDVEARLPSSVSFVGAHPLAGSEKQGAAHARADLFEKKVCVLTPSSLTSAAAVERATLFWETLGFTIRRLSPEEHDLALATTSHLPHFIAVLLANQLPTAWRPYTATGFRDTTRIAGGDPTLWTAIAKENTLALTHALERFGQQVNHLRDAVLAQDTNEIQRLLIEAKKVRDALGS